MKKLIIILLITLGCSGNKTKVYTIFDPHIPSGYVVDRRNMFLFVVGDSGLFMVSTTCHLSYGLWYTYEVGENFSKSGLQDKISKWGKRL